MRLYFVYFSLNLFYYIFGVETDVGKLMKNHQIVPDVIDKAPNELLIIKYNNKIVKFGAELKPSQVELEPTVKWKADNNAYYALIMTDPDVPSRWKHYLRELQHWVVVNILGKNLLQGRVLTDYLGPRPPNNTGLHRYVFLLYKQTEKLKFYDPFLSANTLNGRYGFSTRTFARKYELGQPIAGHFFQSRYE